jgi:CHAT domain-containing protein
VRQHLHSLWDQMIADYQASEYVVLRRGEKVAWEQVQHWLHSQPKHVALVAFYMLIEQVVVFVVREGDVEPAVICLNVSQEDMLAYVMRCWREVYEFDEQEPLRETWQAIGKHEGETPLLDQLMPHLLGAELVYLIPHGLLHLLPLHALTYENKPLIMHAPIAYLPSVAIALRMRQRQPALSVLKQEDVLVLGNPTGDLPDAEEEAGIIVHRFGTRPLAPADATKERVRAAFQHKQLIHLATHAAFNDIDPFASGIMLAPDWQNSTSNVKRMLNNQERDITILTAYEVLEAQLLANLVRIKRL